MASDSADGAGMADVLAALKSIQQFQGEMQKSMESLSSRMDQISPPSPDLVGKSSPQPSALNSSILPPPASTPTTERNVGAVAPTSAAKAATEAQKSGFTSRIILT